MAQITSIHLINRQDDVAECQNDLLGEIRKVVGILFNEVYNLQFLLNNSSFTNKPIL